MSGFFDPFKGAGKIVKQGPGSVTWMMETEDQFVTCTQTLVNPILDANQEEANNNLGKRWGDGKVAARIPLGLYFDKIAPAKKAGDDAYIKRILNDSDYSKLRTFGGRV